MKMLVQRVRSAKVDVGDATVGSIGQGLLVFLGVHHQDTEKEVSWLVNKLVTMRLFKDSHGKMSLSVQDVEGQILVVSQFTLCANCSNGRRPDFGDAAPPQKAQVLYEAFLSAVRESVSEVQSGIFGENMQVHLVNDGPVTLLVERENKQ